MDRVEDFLAAGGLNEKEIKVYLACLQLGTDSAFNISEKSGVKRATTYLVLRALANKGLVTRQLSKKSLLYSVASPRNLLLQIENRKKEVEEGLPALLALYNAVPEKPSIQIFEGMDGVKQLYEEIIEFLEKGEEILFYGSIAHFAEQPALLKSWLKETKAARGNIREILNGDEVHRQYKSDVEANHNPRHELRLVTGAGSVFLNDNAIFSNKVVIFSTQKNFFATVIESREIATSYRTIFNLAWSALK